MVGNGSRRGRGGGRVIFPVCPGLGVGQELVYMVTDGDEAEAVRELGEFYCGAGLFF